MAITNCWLTAKLLGSGATAVDFSHAHNLAIEGSTGFSVLRQAQNNHQLRFVAKTVLIADDSASVRLSVRLLLQGNPSRMSTRFCD